MNSSDSSEEENLFNEFLKGALNTLLCLGARLNEQHVVLARKL